jgi:hypothetical protein
MKSGDTRLLAARFQDLSPFKAAQKVGDELNAWHNRVTFGVHGEQAFSVALYKRLMQSGKFVGEEGKMEAGKLVREALGNYQNVAREGWGVDQVLSRSIFFYPWLKGNLPFWMRMATTPRGYKLAAAPHQAARINNALVADPSETQGKSPSPAGDYAFIEGGLHGKPFDKKRGFSADVPLLPQRMLADAANFAGAFGSGDPTKAVQDAMKIVRSRFQPLVRAGTDIAASADPGRYPDSPLDPQSYDTAFDRRAPTAVQRKELGASIAAELIPIPIIGYEMQDGIRRGLSADQVRQEVMERGVQGFTGQFVYDRLGPRQKVALSRVGEKFTLNASKINKNPNLSDQEKQNRLTRVYNGYADAVHRILGEPVDKKQDEPIPFPSASPR